MVALSAALDATIEELLRQGDGGQMAEPAGGSRLILQQALAETMAKLLGRASYQGEGAARLLGRFGRLDPLEFPLQADPQGEWAEPAGSIPDGNRPSSWKR